MYSIAFVKAYKIVHCQGYLFFFGFTHFHFIRIQIFNNGRRKISKTPLDSAYKYATRSHNMKAKQIIMNERSK